MTVVSAAANPEAHGIMALVDHSRPWYKNRRIVILNCWIFLLLITSTGNGFDGSMMNGLQSLPQWEKAFDNPSGGKLGLLNAIQNIGSIATLPIIPYINDGVGRRLTVFIGALIMVAATVIQTASQSVGMFIGARFLIGFGLGIASNAAPMLVTEIAYPSQRGPLTSVYNALWPGGAVVAAWTTYGSFRIQSSWAWRLPSAMQALPSIIQVIFIMFGPESPRWLIGKGREQEALETLAYYHANGNKEDPLVVYQMEEIKTAIRLEREVNDNVGWTTLFRTPGNRRRFRVILAIAFFSQWSGNGLVSYYLNKVFDTIGITDSNTQLLINAFLNMWSLLWAVGGGLFCDRFGRRTLFLCSTAGMLLFFTLQTICSSLYAQHGKKAAGDAVILWIFLFGSAYAIAYSPLITSYTLEILPFNLRAKGFTLFSFAVSLSLIFNQYVNPIALKALGWKYYIFYCAWDAVELVFVYFFVIETKNVRTSHTSHELPR
ncbi:hexose transporter [Sistotremastrum niveocremeum HHB9708]|uniref:Hexose transporter n=1 Tax=Sistotremastrum niveocremeum HHB9708 TaxID=1314777 RepID=A0A164TNH2_9AGAM|nr:hexose transporter [Sistotremastrum niveocremeum HHB9708]